MKKGLKRLTAAVIIITVVVFLFIVAERILSVQIKKRLKEDIAQFEFQIGEIKTNLLSRQVKFVQVKFSNNEKTASGTIDRVTISGISILSYLLEKEIIIDDIKITDPKIDIAQSIDSTFNKNSEKKNIPRVEIENFNIENAGFLIYTSNKNTDTVFNTGFDLLVKGISIQETKNFNFKNTNFKSLDITVRKGKWNTPNGLYTLTINKGGLNSENKTLQINEIDFSTRYKKYEVAHITNVETDWLDFSLRNFTVNYLNVKDIFQSKNFIFSSIEIDSLDGWVFRDKRLPFPQKPDTHLPVEMIENLNFGFYGDSVLIKNADIVYQEHPEGADNAGKLSFNNLEARLYYPGNIDSLRLNQTKLVAKTNIMEKPLLKAEFTFPSKSGGEYSVSGSLEPTNIEIFNPMIVNKASASIKEGRINRMDFNFTYNDFDSQGVLEMEYNNLKIEVLDEDKSNKKPVKSFILNQFATKKQQPANGKII